MTFSSTRSQDPVHVLDEIPISAFVECNHSRALDFFSKHPRDVSPGGDTFRHLARKTIVTAAKILDSLGIRFWISSGELRTRCIFYSNTKSLYIKYLTNNK